MLVPGTTSATVPTLGVSKDRLYLFLWNPATGDVTYHTLGRNGRLSPAQSWGRAPSPSVWPSIQSAARSSSARRGTRTRRAPHAGRSARYEERAGTLVEKRREFIEGEAGGSRGYGRATVLFDASREEGPNGRIYFFGRGLTTKETPWSCTYVAHEIADKSVRGGWLVKRFYDEWTQTRSAPAAAWFDGDIIWAYRWVDGGQGTTDNNLHVGYRALGIGDKPMGDHDDLTFFKQIGIRRSILYVGSG